MIRVMSGEWLCSKVALFVVFGTTLAATAPLSADDRPTEIVYTTTGAVPTLSAAALMATRRYVVIQDRTLRPQRVVLGKGEQVAWISRSRAPSAIVFEREVAASMICHSLVNFAIEDDELRSGLLHAGDVASFCELQPGRYRYKIRRPDPLMGGAGGASHRLEGVVVVSAP